ncbi:hypothetical protein EV356DRAFT_528192 [Viridothelium virens]|uniref:Uncharacterized protein n=1 Tax=Viridothelium virens TaxID=1048519 RepID=A0A6A6HP27_VIRVR|nr:hypothetical protein EV356DRAFT_528192 [Viridothelium virens]
MTDVTVAFSLTALLGIAGEKARAEGFAAAAPSLQRSNAWCAPSPADVRRGRADAQKASTGTGERASNVAGCGGWRRGSVVCGQEGWPDRGSSEEWLFIRRAIRNPAGSSSPVALSFHICFKPQHADPETLLDFPPRPRHG